MKKIYLTFVMLVYPSIYFLQADGGSVLDLSGLKEVTIAPNFQNIKEKVVLVESLLGVLTPEQKEAFRELKEATNIKIRPITLESVDSQGPKWSDLMIRKIQSDGNLEQHQDNLMVAEEYFEDCGFYNEYDEETYEALGINWEEVSVGFGKISYEFEAIRPISGSKRIPIAYQVNTYLEIEGYSIKKNKRSSCTVLLELYYFANIKPAIYELPFFAMVRF